LHPGLTRRVFDDDSAGIQGATIRVDEGRGAQHADPRSGHRCGRVPHDRSGAAAARKGRGASGAVRGDAASRANRGAAQTAPEASGAAEGEVPRKGVQGACASSRRGATAGGAAQDPDDAGARRPQQDLGHHSGHRPQGPADAQRRRDAGRDEGAAEGSGKGLGSGSAGKAFDENQVDKAVEVSRKVDPRYPDALKSVGVQGNVVMRFIVGTDGRVEPGSIQAVSSPHKLFSDAVRSALLNTRYRPAEAGGQKVRQLVEQVFTFKLT
jgi:TonB family protein